MLGVIKTQTDIVKLGLDLGGVMALVAERTQALTGAAGSVVELAEGEDMVYRAATGMAANQLGLRLKLSTSLSGLCVRSGSPLNCEDSETDERVDREACRRVGLRSMIVVPLKHNDALVGVLKVMARTPKAFTPADLAILGMMSELIAAAMFHATKYEADALFHQATHDSLTGLANRALFFDRLRQNLAQAQRNSQRLAILNLDMDGLKPINDQHGHRAGDAALKELASRIKNTSRESDTVARVGGDEFGVILPNIDGYQRASLQSQRLSQHLRSPFQFEGQKFALDASIGFAVFPEDGDALEMLIEKADQSMYEMKRQRKERRV
jgi:diguanylate cyclase (GGDEF)-like protein